MKTYYNGGNVTIEEVLAIAPGLQGRGKEKKGPCPYCQAEGGDTSGDNLHFHPDRGAFCGACENNSHASQLFKDIHARRREKQEAYQKSSKISYKDEDVRKYSQELINNNDMLNLVIKATGLTKKTIKDCKIGYIKEDEVFTLPMYDIDGGIVGLEFRKPENSKGKAFGFVSKTKGYAADPKRCLSKINTPLNPKKALICAGYKDGYAAYQYLQELGLADEYMILTNTNGEPSTAKALKENIEFLGQFEQVILCLDNDKAGKIATKQIEKEIPVPVYKFDLSHIKGIDEYINDFNDFYKHVSENKITGNLIQENLRLSIYSVLKFYIKHVDVPLNKRLKAEISPEHADILEFLPEGIYAYRNCYFNVRYDQEKCVVAYRRKSNFTINILRTVIFNTFGHENRQEYKLEITTNVGDKTTKSQILTQKELQDVRNLHEVLKEGGVHIHSFTDTEFKNILLEELKNCSLELHIYKNPSLVIHKGKEYWAYANAIIDLSKDEILVPEEVLKNKTSPISVGKNNELSLSVDKGMHAPNLFIPKENIKTFFEKSKDSFLKEFQASSETIQAATAKAFCLNTVMAYNNKIEAFMAVGTALMSPFVNILYEKTLGYPINFLYGEAASGKSNLLQTIACIFGFDIRYLSSGNDTAYNLLHNTEYYNALPILYSEIENNLRKGFETTVKAVYDRNSRKRMTNFGKDQDIRAVNATLHFASNDRAHKNSQTATRLVYTEFYKADFSPKEASKLNHIRENYISCILPEILKFYKDKEFLLNEFDIIVKAIKEIQPDIDLRCVNNIAIAKLGMDLLFKVAGFAESFYEGVQYKTLIANFANYIKSYETAVSTQDCFEKFLEIFLVLAKQNKINYGNEYVFSSSNKTISIYLKDVYPLFKKEYKQMEDYGTLIPDAKDIKNYAKKRKYEVEKVVHFKKEKTNRCIQITVKDNDEFLKHLLDQLLDVERERVIKERAKKDGIRTKFQDSDNCNEKDII